MMGFSGSTATTETAVSSATSLALAALIVGAICIGFAPVLAKHAVNVDIAADGSRLSPVAVACWRMILAVPFFVVSGATKSSSRHQDLTKAWRNSLKDWGWLILPGLAFALDLATWHTSFEYTSVANATLLANFAAVFVALASWIWFGEHFSYLFGLGAAVALVGMTGLVGASFAREGDAWIGDLMGMFVAMAYAGYLLSTKFILARHQVRIVMTWSTAVAGFLLAIIALSSPGRFIPVTLLGWFDVIALALVSQVAGQGLIAFGMSHLPASFSSVTLIVQPLCAAVFGWILLAQPLSAAQAICGGIVICGIYLAKRGSRI